MKQKDARNFELDRRQFEIGRLMGENMKLRAALAADALEPLVTKAMGEYTEAVFKDNYRGYQERFIAEYLAKALSDEQSPRTEDEGAELMDNGRNTGGKSYHR